MGTDIHKLIAAISPEVYCIPNKRGEVKKIAKESGYSLKGYLAAAEEAKAVPIEPFNYELLHADPFLKLGVKYPSEMHTIVYDSAAEGLEPIYFWVLDQMNLLFKKVDKLVDNFISSPGSGHFSELQTKATRMQEEAMKMLGAVNQVIKSILNLVYDLKEFQMRIDLYDRLNDPKTRSSAILSLKQLWMDTVDIKRGNSSIKGLTLGGQSYFVTLIDAFMAANEKLEYGGEQIDLNDRVKRILEQRIAEFFSWLKISDKELRKRYEIERLYLKSQYNNVKLYARWLKPYLKAARDLEQRANAKSPALVNAFNTVLFELALLGKEEYDPVNDVIAGELPRSFRNATKKKYYSILITEFNFRSIPQKVGQHYAFGGRTEIKFTSYSLNEQEIDLLGKCLEEDNVDDLFKITEGMTTESLDQLKDDLKEFIGEDVAKDKKKEEKKSDDINPFSALFSLFKSEEKKHEAGKGIPQDSLYEQIIRSQASANARDRCFLIFDLYKKAHGMPSHYDVYARL